MEVFGPSIGPRVKQSDDCPRVGIDSGDIGSFVVIASKAGKSEILLNRRTSVFNRNDMINLKRKRVESRWHTAILACIVRALPDKPFEFPSHEELRLLRWVP